MLPRLALDDSPAVKTTWSGSQAVKGRAGDAGFSPNGLRCQRCPGQKHGDDYRYGHNRGAESKAGPPWTFSWLHSQLPTGQSTERCNVVEHQKRGRSAAEQWHNVRCLCRTTASVGRNVARRAGTGQKTPDKGNIEAGAGRIRSTQFHMAWLSVPVRVRLSKPSGCGQRSFFSLKNSARDALQTRSKPRFSTTAAGAWIRILAIVRLRCKAEPDARK